MGKSEVAIEAVPAIWVTVEEGNYVASFMEQDRQINLPIGPVDEITSYYKEELAQWIVEDYMAQKRLEEYQWKLLS